MLCIVLRKELIKQLVHHVRIVDMNDLIKRLYHRM